MKKFIIGCSLFCFIALQASAQIPTFTLSDNVLNLGVGFGGSWYPGYGLGYTGVSRTPIFSASFEHCIIQNVWDAKSSIGAGGLIGYSSISWKDSDWRINNIFIGGRGALHYAFVDNLDVYAGLMVGYKFVTHNTDLKRSSEFAPDLFAGARYYFAGNVSVFAEAGYWMMLNMGISFKF